MPATFLKSRPKAAVLITDPILKDGEAIVADSTNIALYLEKAYPTVPLLPADGQTRMKVLAIEGICDDLGDDVRRWVYGQLRSHPDLGRVLFDAYPAWQRLLGKAMTPLMRLGLQKLYRVYPQKVAQAEKRMWAGLDQLAEAMNGRTQGYLFGDRISLADIAAASMYGPLLGPAGMPWQDTGTPPPQFAEAVSKARSHPAGQWMMWLYEHARHRKV